ncbi:hypothetical protein YC2023_084573 [Brassica napus]
MESDVVDIENDTSLNVEVTCKTKVTTLKRLTGILGGILHSAYFPFRKEKSLWVLLADSNNICFFPKVAFMDRVEAISIASSAII